MSVVCIFVHHVCRFHRAFPLTPADLFDAGSEAMISEHCWFRWIVEAVRSSLASLHRIFIADGAAWCRELSADGWAFVRRLNRDNVGSKRWARKSVESPRRFCRVRLLLGDDRVFDACVKSSRVSHELCKEV